MHWCSSFIGIPYAKMNCAELVAQVMEVAFFRADIAAALRGYPEHAMGLRERTLAISKGWRELAYKVDHPKDGDGVILKIGSKLAHMGIAVESPKGLCVLHTVANRGSVIEPVDKMLTCTIEGFYRWK
jgi:uncharacterized protein YijF (DUF1287 family)